MYVLTYKKKNFISSLLSLMYKHKWMTLIFCLGISQFYQGIYIFAKAEFAQYLIKNAWQKTIKTQDRHAPWPWADTYPVAQLSVDNNTWFILAGASGRNLAFAPTHVSSTPLPGQIGNSVIVGHRDTQFSQLQHVQKGELIEIKTEKKRQKFRITSIRIAHQSQAELLQNNQDMGDYGFENYDTEHTRLTLITCYPFNSVLPNPTHRYIVKAIAI